MRRIITLLLSVVAAFFLSLNIAMLVFEDLYYTLKDGVQSALSLDLPVTPKKAGINSKANSKITELERRNKKLTDDNRKLKTQQKTLNEKISKTNRVGKSTLKSMSRRVSINAARNISAVAVESIPYAGAAAAITITAYELKDACDNLRDIRKLAETLDLDLSSNDRSFCGITIEDLQAYNETSENPCEAFKAEYSFSDLSCLPTDPTLSPPTSPTKIYTLPQDPTLR